MLPGIDGFEVCRRVRAAGPVPIIMLTARGDDFDVVGGLEAGADDYVVKPVQPRVLDARIRAVLRRADRDPAPAGAHRYGDLVIDRTALTVTKGGQPVSLTPTELRLLLELSRSPGQVLTREQLLQSVWEHDYLGDSRLVDACVQRLRAKIEDDAVGPGVRADGTRLRIPVRADVGRWRSRAVADPVSQPLGPRRWWLSACVRDWCSHSSWCPWSAGWRWPAPVTCRPATSSWTRPQDEFVVRTRDSLDTMDPPLAAAARPGELDAPRRGSMAGSPSYGNLRSSSGR